MKIITAVCDSAGGLAKNSDSYKINKTHGK